MVVRFYRVTIIFKSIDSTAIPANVLGQELRNMLYDQFSDSSAEECLVGNDEGIGLLKRNRHLEKHVFDIHETLLSLEDHAEDHQKQTQYQRQQIQHHRQEIEHLQLFSVSVCKI